MPEKVERHLRAAGRKAGKSGRALDRYVYGAMNNMGLMKGNKPVPNLKDHVKGLMVSGKLKGKKLRRKKKGGSKPAVSSSGY